MLVFNSISANITYWNLLAKIPSKCYFLNNKIFVCSCTHKLLVKSSSPYAYKIFAEDKYLKKELKTRRSGFVLEFWCTVIHNNIHIGHNKGLEFRKSPGVTFSYFKCRVDLFICDWDLAHFFITAILKVIRLCILVLLFTVYVWIEKSWTKTEQELGREPFSQLNACGNLHHYHPFRILGFLV